MIDYWNQVLPTHIENWPYELLHRSIPTRRMKLTPAQANALRTLNLYNRESGLEPIPANAERVLEEMKLTLSALMFHDSFVRLGSRSPKDSWEAAKIGFRSNTPSHAIRLLLDSERVYDDLRLAKRHDYLPSIVVREWQDIKEWQEFRTFIWDRKLVGISQYFYHDFYPEIQSRSQEIEDAIRKEAAIIAPLLPVDNVIADFFLGEIRGELVARLLEINPYFRHTDPCLFDWDEPPHTNPFAFRYIERPVPKFDPSYLLEVTK